MGIAEIIPAWMAEIASFDTENVATRSYDLIFNGDISSSEREEEFI